MKEETVKKLLQLNQEFYQRFGAAFAETRRRIQPGVARVLVDYIHDGDWLDLGCGSGALISSWIKTELKGSYTGLDFSEALLCECRSNLAQQPEHPDLAVRYIQADLLDSNLNKKVDEKGYDGVLAFASLHHLPGAQHRAQVIHTAVSLLKPGGVFIHSEWQFQHSAKMMSRVLPWAVAGIAAEEVDPGDTLLDWRHAAAGQENVRGLRYVHLFTRDELTALAFQNGCRIVSEFESDGKGGNLALYQVWQKN